MRVRVVDQAEIYRLVHSQDWEERKRALEELKNNFSILKYQEHAWIDLMGLTRDNNDTVRSGAANALGSCYSHIPEEYRKQAWDDLHRLTQDKDDDVRIAVNYSSGRISIYRASQSKSNESVRKELETALRFFEKASNRSYYNSNPAKFCLPFYRSFYAITFRKENAEAEVKQYLAEAKKAVEGSESKENLLEAVENLGNALKEAQKTRDLNAITSNLNTYRHYCDRACELLDATEEIAPGASRLIRKGLPIIDEMIKEIIGGIQRHSNEIYNQTKNTPLKELGLKTCKQTQELSLQDPLDLNIGLEKIINTAKEWCEYIRHDDKKKSVCEKLKSLGDMEIQEKVIVFSEIFEYLSTNLHIPRIQRVYICDTQKQFVRVAIIQICYQLTKSFPFVIENKDAVKAKIFSGLNLAKNDGVNMVCLPELCLCEEWIPEIEKKYPDMTIISGGYYKDNKNICPVIMKSDLTLPYQSKITPAGLEDREMWENAMIPGDRIYKYETKFGKFVILICRDFERFAHYFREIDIDFIFCPAFNDANERFHVEANNHVTKTPSYILIANTGTFGGSSIFAQLNKNHFVRLVVEGCKDDGDMSFKLCEAKEGKDEVIIADFNLTHKSIQVPIPSESSEEKRSVTHIRKLRIPNSFGN